MQDEALKNTLNLLKEILSRKRRIVDFLGHKIIVEKNVFPIDSPFSISSKIIAENLNPNKTDLVLDIGTGTGALAIIAAKKGVRSVIGIDTDKNALKNAKENVKLHKLEKFIEIRKSNLFENIKPEEKFDIITANIPLTNVDYKSELSHFLFDPGFKLHERFLRDAKKHLMKNGIILIPTGDVGDEKKLLELIKKYDYEIKKIEEEKFNDLIWKLYILKKRSVSKK